MNKLFKFFMFLSIPLLSLLAVSCDDDEVVDDEPASPTITSVSPEEGLPGTAVTITGTDLDNATAIRFGNFEATITNNTATSITTAVPDDATAGSQQISVTTAGRNGTHAFTVLEEQTPAATIVSFAPEEGAAGETITITGTNFDADNILTIMLGDVEITEYTVEDETTIVFVVPENAETGTVIINPMQGDPTESEVEFVVVGNTVEARVYNNVEIHAQGARMKEGILTVFNTATGTTHHYTEPVDDEELARNVDFLLFDTNGSNNWAIMEPNPQGDASWLQNNFYKDVEWAHTNATMLRVLEDADEDFFQDATAEVIEALPIGESEDDHAGRIDPIAVGDVILYESSNGNKGLIYFRSVAQDDEESYKDDIFTVDVKVVMGEDRGEE
jgi:hypothetical protein